MCIRQTTAHTLCFALALLALYPYEQEKLYQHIKSVIPNPEAPVRLHEICNPLLPNITQTYEDMPLLTQTMA
jgi:cytochrome P450